MSSCSYISPWFWISETGRELRGDPEAQTVAMYLLTCQSANVIGLFHLPLATMAKEIGFTTEAAALALHRVCEIGLAKWDETAEVVWVSGVVAGRIIKKPFKATGPGGKKAANAAYSSVPSNRFLGEFFDECSELFCLDSRRDS